MKDKKEDKKPIKKSGLGVAWITFLVLIVLTILTFIIAPLLISSILFIFIYLPIMIYILIYKWIDRWFAALVFSFSLWLNIIIILIPIAGGLLALDLMQFSKDFAEDPKYVVLNDNGLVFGVSLSSSQQSDLPFSTLTQEELSQIQNEVSSNSLEDKIVFVVEKDFFRNVDVIEVQDAGITTTKEEIFEFLKSNDTTGFLANTEAQNSNQLKSMALILLFQKAVEESGTEYVVSELKNGNIKIYPERTSLKILIKIIPESLLSGLLPDLTGLSDQGLGMADTNQLNEMPSDFSGGEEFFKQFAEQRNPK